MTWMHGVWIAVGVVLGVLHAQGIWRTAHHRSATTAIVGMVRLLVVGLALTVAAIFGGILPAAGGWVIGLLTSVVAVLAMQRTSSKRRSEA